MRLIDADHLSERVNNSADAPMQKLYVDALLAGEPTVAEPSKKPQTNADRIRAMSDEELAQFLESTHANMAIKLGGEYIVRAKEYIGIWLQQPVKDGEGDGE